MKILLQRHWFAPDGHRRRQNTKPLAEPHDVPDEWEDLLPPGAEIVHEIAPDENAEIGDLGEEQLSAQKAFKEKLQEEANKAALSGVLDPDGSAAQYAAQNAAAEADTKRQKKSKK
jgi:hypothetical protein